MWSLRHWKRHHYSWYIFRSHSVWKLRRGKSKNDSDISSLNVDKFYRESVWLFDCCMCGWHNTGVEARAKHKKTCGQGWSFWLYFSNIRPLSWRKGWTQIAIYGKWWMFPENALEQDIQAVSGPHLYCSDLLRFNWVSTMASSSQLCSPTYSSLNYAAEFAHVLISHRFEDL